ncbi:MAG TPA: MerR family transcriptional regulator [Ilumatobacteraceae bacterium]|nr:MerR family transcriptional regulator [Ilumatobacteraceae bacterium]
MPEVQNTSYLSIGEVLGLLLAEFPDITISKIRFLESQGLIAPERTPSGYRKFYEPDVELLKVILREQRENYLPLRVIKDRIDSGAIDPSGEMTKPDGLADVQIGADPGHDARDDVRYYEHPGDQHGADEHRNDEHPGRDHRDELDVEVPAATIAAHPAAKRSAPDASPPPADSGGTDASTRGANGRSEGNVTSPQLLPGVLLEAGELCAMTSITSAELDQLRSYGIVTGRESGGTTLYGDDAVEIAKVAAEFLRAGVDARHLRGWRTAVEREASLFEQLITPRLRQRNPESRTEALNELRRLDALGARLRAALMRTALRHHFEG